MWASGWGIVGKWWLIFSMPDDTDVLSKREVSCFFRLIVRDPDCRHMEGDLSL